MSLTIAQIAAKAVNAVQGAITDAVAVATVYAPCVGRVMVATATASVIAPWTALTALAAIWAMVRLTLAPGQQHRAP